jgi:hypothetical protein
MRSPALNENFADARPLPGSTIDTEAIQTPGRVKNGTDTQRWIWGIVIDEDPGVSGSGYSQTAWLMISAGNRWR